MESLHVYFLHFTSKYNTNNMERVQFKLCSLGEPKVSLPKVSPSVMLENINGESLNLNSFQTVFQFRLFSCRLNFHGDELHPLGGAELGAESGAEQGGGTKGGWGRSTRCAGLKC